MRNSFRSIWIPARAGDKMSSSRRAPIHSRTARIHGPGPRKLPETLRPRRRSAALDATGGKNPHPGGVGHLRERRRRRGGAGRVPQAHRRVRARRHPPATDRLHGPVQLRAHRRGDDPRKDGRQVREGGSRTRPPHLHAARPGRPARRGPPAGLAPGHDGALRAAVLRLGAVRAAAGEGLPPALPGQARGAEDSRVAGAGRRRQLLRAVPDRGHRQGVARAGAADQGHLPHRRRGGPGRDPRHARPGRTDRRAPPRARRAHRPALLRNVWRRGVLQPPEPHRAAQQRDHRPGEPLRVRTLQRVRGAGAGAGPQRSGVGGRAGDGVEAPRAGRRGGTPRA